MRKIPSSKIVILLALTLSGIFLLGIEHSTLPVPAGSDTTGVARLAGTVNVRNLPGVDRSAPTQAVPNVPRFSGGTGPSILPRTSSIQSAPEPSNAPLYNLSSTIVSASAGFDGLVAFQSCPCNPPDPIGAPGPNHIFEMVNFAGEIFTKQGAAVKNFTLASFFNTGPDFISDPKVLYDAPSGRWFASIISLDKNFSTTGVITHSNVTFAVSTSNDPTSTWTIYNINTSPNLPDQPIIGISDDKFILSANDYNSHLSVFLGAQYWVVNKNDLVAISSSPRITSFGPFLSLESVHPVQSLSSTTTQYMVTVGAGDIGTNSTSVRLVSITGLPGVSTVNNASSVLPVNLISIPPPAQEPSTVAGPTQMDTGDFRVQDAVWSQGKLWLGLNDACQTVSCIRLTQIDTAASSVTQDFDFFASGIYYFYPAFAMDSSGNLQMVYGYSSTSIYPSLAVTGQKTTDPVGSLASAVTIKAGNGVNYDDRYGDYFGAGVDPSDTSVVWVVGQYHTRTYGGCDIFAWLGETCWATFIDSMSFNGFTMSAIPSTVSFNAASSAQSTINVTSVNGFSGTVSLTTASTSPNSLTISCNPSNLSLGTSALSTCTFSSSTPGTYTATVTGTSGSRFQQTTVTVMVVGFSATASPTFKFMAPGSSSNFAITLASVNGFTGTIGLTATVSPSTTNGPTANLNPATVSITPYASGSSTLTVTTISQTPSGLFTVTVTGTSGSESHAVFIPLGVSVLSVSATNTTTFSGVTVTTTVSFTVADFSISASPNPVSFHSGGSGSTTVSLGSLGGFSGAVSLSTSTSPSTGLTVSCPSSVTVPSGGTANANCTFSSSTTNIYSVTVTGTSGLLSHAVVVTVNVGIFSISANPVKVALRPGSSASSTITLTSINGFTGTVNLAFTVSPIVKSHPPTVTLSPTSVSVLAFGSGTSTLTFSTGSRTPLGLYSVTVTGTSGSESHSVIVSFNVTSTLSNNPVFDSNLASSGSLTGSSSTTSSTTGAPLSDPTITLTGSGTATVVATNATSKKHETLFSMTYNLTSLTFSSSTPGIYRTLFLLNIAVNPYPLSSNIIITWTGPTRTVSITVTRNVDINANGMVDNADSKILNAAFGCVQGNSCYNPRADLNADGTVDSNDNATLNAYFSAPDFLPDYTISSSAVFVSVPYATTVNVTISLTSVNGFSGTVALTTADFRMGLLAPYSELDATLSSPSVILTSGSTATVTLSLYSVVAATHTLVVTGTSGAFSNTIIITVNTHNCNSRFNNCPF